MLVLEIAIRNMKIQKVVMIKHFKPKKMLQLEQHKKQLQHKINPLQIINQALKEILFLITEEEVLALKKELKYFVKMDLLI